jgi:hypothetical protein
MADARLYVIPDSHPSRTAMLMLERKGIPFKRVDLLPMVSKGVLKVQRFPGITVPALKIDTPGSPRECSAARSRTPPTPSRARASAC